MKLNNFNKKLKNEYHNTFEEKIQIKSKNRFNFNFKFRYLLMGLPALIVFFFASVILIDHISVTSYNNSIDDRMNAVLNNTSKELEKVQSNKDLNSKLEYVDFTPRESFLDYLFSKFEDENFATGGDVPDMAPDAPNASPDISEDSNNSYETNIQTEGVDELDYAKCDGKYIYAIQNSMFYIYDLDGNLLEATGTNAKGLYLYNNMVVVLANSKTVVYTFDGNDLTNIKAFYHSMMIESRLVDNMLYLVVRDNLNTNTEDYSNMYYDGCLKPNYVYSIISFNLNNYDTKCIKLVNAYNSILYASKNNFYLVSNNYINGYATTFVSVVDINLNPIGVIRLKGTVLNQFCLDENNGYIRIASIDNSKSNDEINSISIFSLDTLERTGYLNKGIGKPGQQLKSARFEGNTCYVVTYLTKDPLYEIDCSDPTNPVITDFYESPGYSSYLHTFKINGKNYLFGLGYTDSFEPKLSIYHDDENLTQIGEDLVFNYRLSYIENLDNYYYCDSLSQAFVNNHKMLFIYNDNNYLYIGAPIGYDQYTIFKIDVNNNEMPISVYKEFKNITYDYYRARGFLVNDKFYIVLANEKIIIENWK